MSKTIFESSLIHSETRHSSNVGYIGAILASVSVVMTLQTYSGIQRNNAEGAYEDRYVDNAGCLENSVFDTAKGALSEQSTDDEVSSLTIRALNADNYQPGVLTFTYTPAKGFARPDLQPDPATKDFLRSAGCQ